MRQMFRQKLGGYALQQQQKQRARKQVAISAGAALEIGGFTI